MLRFVAWKQSIQVLWLFGLFFFKRKLLIKEASLFQLAPKDEIMNNDEGIKLPGSLIKSVCDTILPAKAFS